MPELGPLPAGPREGLEGEGRGGARVLLHDSGLLTPR